MGVEGRLAELPFEQLLPRAPLLFSTRLLPHAHLALHLTQTHVYDASPRPPFYAGKMAAIEERVKNMGPDEAQAARDKAAENARKRGA